MDDTATSANEHEPRCPRDGGVMVRIDEHAPDELGAEWLDVGQYRCQSCGFVGWPV